MLNKKITDTMLQEADWLNNTDSMLSRKWNVSRERVRQIRNNFGAPKCIYFQKREKTKKNIIWLNENREKLQTEYARRVVEQMPEKTDMMAGYKLLKSVKFSCNFSQGWRSNVNYSNMNWNLPNIVLGKIWGAKAYNFATIRHRTQKGSPKWRVNGFNKEKLKENGEFMEAINQEIIKSGKDVKLEECLA